MNRARLEALCTVLIDSGDMTPMAKRMLLRAHDEDVAHASDDAVPGCAS